MKVKIAWSTEMNKIGTEMSDRISSRTHSLRYIEHILFNELRTELENEGITDRTLPTIVLLEAHVENLYTLLSDMRTIVEGYYDFRNEREEHPPEDTSSNVESLEDKINRVKTILDEKKYEIPTEE